MYVERFPRRAYMKRLRQMHMELMDWERKYKRMSQWTESESLGGRLDQRAAIMEETARRVDSAVQLLDELPRLK